MILEENFKVESTLIKKNNDKQDHLTRIFEGFKQYFFINISRTTIFGDFLQASAKIKFERIFKGKRRCMFFQKDIWLILKIIFSRTIWRGFWINCSSWFFKQYFFKDGLFSENIFYLKPNNKIYFSAPFQRKVIVEFVYKIFVKEQDLLPLLRICCKHQQLWFFYSILRTPPLRQYCNSATNISFQFILGTVFRQSSYISLFYQFLRQGSADFFEKRFLSTNM